MKHIKTSLISIIVLMLIGTLCVFGRDVITLNEGWSFKKGTFSSDPILFSQSANRGWQQVNIPHTWNNRDMMVDKNSYYTGEAYYKRTYTPEQSMSDKRTFLRFEGVGSVAEVYVNGTYAGNHKGAYSAFVVEVTKLLKYGEENELLVKVDNSPRPDVIPINNTLFGVYGGIYRNVDLIVTDKINFAVNDYASPGVYISQENVSAKSANVDVKLKLDNKYKDDKAVKLVASIYEMDGKLKMTKDKNVVLSPQGRQHYSLDFTINKPHLWQGLDDPYLYKVVTQVVYEGKVVDEVTQPLGLRHVELKAADGVYLNGKKIPMYGVCRHQDWWEKGSALAKAEHDADLAMIKEIGATTIRFAHYQQAEDIYAKCDSIGFLIWAEIPFVNRVSTQEHENAKQQLTELIRQNYNHPSIYVWGLHNEVYTPYNYTVALTTELDELAKSEDPYRYTVSVNGHSTVDQESNLNADIQGINHYFGWYGWKDKNRGIWEVEDWIEGMEKDFPNYKVIFSEYGAEANIDHQQEVVGNVGNCCGFDKQYNETFATKFHEVQWSIINKHPYLLASYVWNMFDFGTPVAAQGGVLARNMKGLVTIDRKTKKDPFYWYKANWSKEPTLYLTQRRAFERENKITPITVYSNIGTPQLFVNGKEVTSLNEGLTAVHYIFENVELSEGENRIKTTAVIDGKSYEDEIVWYYSLSNKKDVKEEFKRDSTEEHIGL